MLTAARADDCDAAHLQAAVDSMLTLNRHAAHLARAAGVRTCTDVTGFSLLGHAEEMARGSGARIVIDASGVPVLPGALEYARAGHVTGGADTESTRAGGQS